MNNQRHSARWMPLALALLPLSSPGCATAPTSAAARSAGALAPLSFPVTVVAGEVEARLGDQAAFSTLAAGTPTARVGELRAARGGAVVLGSAEAPRGKIWLRPDSGVKLGEDGHGGLVVSVTRGEARARSFEEGSKLSILSGERLSAAPRADVLLRVDQGAVATASDPRGADWTSGVEAVREETAAGIGSLEARTPDDKSAHVTLASVRVDAELAGDLAETRVEHVFHNDGEERLEGTFRFPLPDEAELVGLSLEINGRMADGELVEIDKARRTYESIVDEMRDPALLEWEHGSTFKLRVFPIEPRSDKRIVIRYVAPLRRDLGRYEYVYPTAAPALTDTIGAFRLDFQGKTVVNEKAFRPRGEIAVPVAGATPHPDTLEERRPDGTYTAVHVKPDWAALRAGLAAPASTAPRAVIVLCDTSRSSLEGRGLGLTALGAVLAELGPRDRFMVVAADVDQTDHAPELEPATPAAEAAAIHFIEGIEPDGASDLGAALRHAGKLAARARAADAGATVQIVYLGDGHPTWGETDAAALRRVAAEELGSAPLFGVLLGREVEADLMRELTAARGGWVARPRSPIAARRFAIELLHATETAALAHVQIAAGEGHSVGPLGDLTLLEGDDLVALVRTPPGAAPPASLELRAKAGDHDVSLKIPVTAPVKAKHVARRWATQEIGALEKLGDKKDEIVKMSLDYQVMTRQTAFLVLENEEAYARYQIARKQKAKQLADTKPQVSGGDLENVGARAAGSSMDRLQPGDPEIHVPAPADAQSVVVVFPFGETKVATWDAELRQWVVRFLVDAGTEDGVYAASVRITHRDGRVELTSVEYVIDTLKPAVTLRLVPTGVPGELSVRATQVIGDAEIQSAVPAAQRAEVERARRTPRHPVDARIADLRRVDVRFEDGTVLRLVPFTPGELRAVWTPRAALTGPVKVHVVAVDRALNQSASDVELVLEAR
jgi:hypothetical protein